MSMSRIPAVIICHMDMTDIPFSCPDRISDMSLLNIHVDGINMKQQLLKFFFF